MTYIHPLMVRVVVSRVRISQVKTIVDWCYLFIIYPTNQYVLHAIDQSMVFLVTLRSDVHCAQVKRHAYFSWNVHDYLILNL